MRHHQLAVLCAAFLVLTVATSNRATAAPIVVDFESFTGTTSYAAGDPIPPVSRLSNQLLATFGVLFSSSSPYVAVLNLKAGHAASGVNGIGGSTAAGTIGYDTNAPITFSFWDPKNTSNPATTNLVSVTGDSQAVAGQSSTLSAYNLQNQLVASVTHSDVAGQIWALSAPSIHSAVWSGIAPPGISGIALDDLTFNPVTPEPSTIGFLGLTLLTAMVRFDKARSRQQRLKAR